MTYCRLRKRRFRNDFGGAAVGFLCGQTEKQKYFFSTWAPKEREREQSEVRAPTQAIWARREEEEEARAPKGMQPHRALPGALALFLAERGLWATLAGACVTGSAGRTLEQVLVTVLMATAAAPFLREVAERAAMLCQRDAAAVEPAVPRDDSEDAGSRDVLLCPPAEDEPAVLGAGQARRRTWPCLVVP